MYVLAGLILNEATTKLSLRSIIQVTYMYSPTDPHLLTPPPFPTHPLLCTAVLRLENLDQIYTRSFPIL